MDLILVLRTAKTFGSALMTCLTSSSWRGFRLPRLVLLNLCALCQISFLVSPRGNYASRYTRERAVKDSKAFSYIVESAITTIPSMLLSIATRLLSSLCLL
jgi:hypothetical protein